MAKNLIVYCAPEIETVKCEATTFLCISPETANGGLDDLDIINDSWD